MKTKISLSLVFLVFALSGTCVFAGDAPVPPLRLAAEKIPGCPKAHVCKDLQYGERQVGKGTKDANSAQTYDLYLPGNVGEIDRTSPFFLFVHGGAWRAGNKENGPAETYAEFWKLVGSKETPPESVRMDGIVATQNYVTLTNGLTQAGVPFVARLEPHSHCRILQRNPETRPWLYENLRKYLKGNKAK
jgi:hypothetical protein